MVTSLWFIGENIAGYLGSGVGGAAYDGLGFEYSTLIVIGLQIIAIFAIVVYQKVGKSTKDMEDDGMMSVVRTPMVLSRRGSVLPLIMVLNAKEQARCDMRRRNTIF